MISAEQAQEIVDKCLALGVDDATVSTLRQQYPGIHFTYCLDDDLPNNQPVIEASGFNLYLVDGREHCLCLTNDFNIATGIVLAEIIAD